MSYINTIMMGDTPVDVYGTECSAEPDVGLMTDYVDIEDLKIGGVSVYELFASYGLLDKAQEYINDAWGGIMKAFPNKNTIIKYAGKFGPIHEKEEIQNGMDLRDYFAAKAMQAIIGKANDRSTTVDEVQLWVGHYAYTVADAMLAERNK